MTKLRNSVGERIRAVRKAKGLTQQQLAELSGLDDAYIGSVERGERNFSIDTLEKILLGLKLSLNELMISTDFLGEVESRQTVLEEFIAITSNISDEQIDILTQINKQILRAFH
ncbi:helix-turn-helix domain-containing protein [Paenibacillus polysaccharolyticus]|uniref:helix-turn-helix domain-containing protein n=1 Tax=Paenibacillus polysaccharolyticus TaxID=582692 RepID=UPI0012B803FD|nr:MULTISPECIES: helix-turn-helix transcriptional regulator [Paenibacillus]